MDKAEFDAVADAYAQLHARNIAASGETPEFFARYKVEDTAKEARAHGVQASEILDFGSGIGNSLPHFGALFPQAQLTCADVSARSLAVSQSRFPHAPARYREITVPLQLPFGTESFDLSFSACVFHHIPHAQHIAWLAELRRVTRAGGLLVVFEHNPFNPLTVSAVRTCEFDENAQLVRGHALLRSAQAAGWQQARLVYRMFFPRALAFARPAERWLRRVPLGAQYYLVARG